MMIIRKLGKWPELETKEVKKPIKPGDIIGKIDVHDTRERRGRLDGH